MSDRGKLIWSLLVLAISFALIWGVVGYLEDSQRYKPKAVGPVEQENDEDAETEPRLKLYDREFAYASQMETYLIIGTDSIGTEEETEEDYEGAMADFLALVAMDLNNKKLYTLQLNTDTVSHYVSTDDDGKEETTEFQLCEAPQFGKNKEKSNKKTVQAVSQLLGDLKIDGCYTVPIAALPKLNGIVGGVKVEITDDFSAVDPSMKKGETISLSDEQAQYYLCSNLNGGEDENTSRMRRQQEFLRGFLEKLKASDDMDAQYAVELYAEFKDVATTDIKLSTMSRLLSRCMKYENCGLYTFEGQTTAGKRLDDGELHVRFFLDEDSVISVLTEIYGLTEIDSV
ncbi:MAG: LCP family protein [Blautia sp.]|nr:LCP family protein [Blautia sp.]